jgi:hypothetical protein
MKRETKGAVLSSLTATRGAMIEHSWTAFRAWDFSRSLEDNLTSLVEANPFGATGNWLTLIYKVFHSRIDPVRDRPLILLAKGGMDRVEWEPLFLWHLTRDDLLLREFLTTWLWEQYVDGAFRIDTEDVALWLEGVEAQHGITWAASTRKRTASGLLSVAAAVGLLAGTVSRRFTAYHLPEASFLYLLHAMAEGEPNARRLVNLPDWRMYRMRPEDVEAELLRLHQFRRVHYDVAGSLSQLKLPAPSLADWVAGVTG